MMRLWVVFFALGGSALTASAQHTQVRLVPAAQTARQGDTVWVAVPLHMDAGWHTYWRNPGESGMPTTIKWTLPFGVTPGDIRWPVPGIMLEAGITTYIYKKDATLLVPLTLAPDLKPGPVELKAKLSWLECEAQGVPGEATVTATLNVGSETQPAKDAATVAAWQKGLPPDGSALAAVALENAALRLHRRFDFEHHAVRAAGDRPENSRLRRPGQGRSPARAPAGTHLCSGRAGFVSHARRPSDWRQSRGSQRRLGNAVWQSAISGGADGAGDVGGAEFIRPVRN